MTLCVPLPSIWSFVLGWFTPTVIFLLLNLLIFTIAISSTPFGRSRSKDPNPNNPKLRRTSSSAVVLDRLRSLSLYRHPSLETTSQSAPKTKASQIAEIPAPIHHDEADHHYGRSRSDAGPASAVESESPESVRKTARAKALAPRRRAAAVEEEVDAMADDFINRFRQQLELQRLDSIKSYAEMLKNSMGWSDRSDQSIE